MCNRSGSPAHGDPAHESNKEQKKEGCPVSEDGSGDEGVDEGPIQEKKRTRKARSAGMVRPRATKRKN